MENMNVEQAKKLLRLRNWCDAVIGGVLVLRMEDEFKFSPYGEANLDRDCYWMDREEVRAIASGK